MRILVTGGAGFIGSAVVRHLVGETDATVLNVDALTYAGNLATVADVADDPGYHFAQADLADAPAVRRLFGWFEPDAVIHLAAETHVDRSIDDPGVFIQSNIVGTFNLLEAALGYWRAAPAEVHERFRMVHVSTDEVYGSLGDDGAFSEASPYRPNSPYAASKAAADHLARAWHTTYELPVMVTNCSNNYGAYQHAEKLIPLMIRSALAGRSLPVYGQGRQVREWLYVGDHARALLTVLRRGQPGETYVIGSGAERRNIEVVDELCGLLDELAPRPDGRSYREQINFVADRPGHDQRYAIDAGKIMTELGWRPEESFASGLRKTVRWYLEHPEWCAEATAISRRGLGRGAAS